MRIINMPFVATGTDIALYIGSASIMITAIVAMLYGFWKLHELLIKKAHQEQHHQIGLIATLTWIGFVWHWVWVIAVFIAFIDTERALIKIRDVWRNKDNQYTLEELNHDTRECEAC